MGNSPYNAMPLTDVRGIEAADNGCPSRAALRPDRHPLVVDGEPSRAADAMRAASARRRDLRCAGSGQVWLACPPRIEARSAPEHPGRPVFDAVLGVLDHQGAAPMPEPRDLAKKDLSHVNLSGTDLTEADLHESQLRHATLRHTTLTGADLTGADLTQANLRGASLREATAAHANLAGADLRQTDLTGANLRGAQLTDAKLEDGQREAVTRAGGRLDPIASAASTPPPAHPPASAERDDAAAWQRGDAERDRAMPLPAGGDATGDPAAP
jgi:hypothetical protein